jgi:DNA-binding CsgD family transcriptional regulator
MGSRPLDTAGTLARHAIARLCAAEVEPLALLEHVARRIGSVVPYEAGGWLLTDPVTMLHTGAYAEAVPPALHLQLIDNELTAPDYAKFADVAALPRPVARLRDATGGRPDRSARHRTLYAPAGYGGEVRVAFRAGGACWGVACLARSAGRAEFSEEEVAFLAAVSADVGHGLRSALTAGPEVRAADGAAPAVVVVDDDGVLESCTGDAERWLAALDGDDLGLPAVVHEVARLARARDATGTGPRPSARVRVRDGGWLVVHGARLRGGAARPGRTAVTLGPAGPSDLLPLLLERFELTPRERQVTRLLLRGAATGEIARALGISRHTVRDHTKAIFAKTGASSRPELTARLFHEDVLPRLAAPMH